MLVHTNLLVSCDYFNRLLVGLGASVEDCTVKRSAEAISKVRAALNPLLEKEINVTYSSPPPAPKK